MWPIGTRMPPLAAKESEAHLIGKYNIQERRQRMNTLALVLDTEK